MSIKEKTAKIKLFFTKNAQILALCLISSWIFASSVIYKAANYGGENAKNAVFLISFAGAFIVLISFSLAFNTKLISGFALAVTSLLYGALIAWGRYDFYLFISLMAVYGVIGMYLLRDKWRSPFKTPLPARFYVVFLTFCAVAFVIWVGGYGVARYLTYRTPCYDFGIFSQMFYYMKTDFSMNTTCERSRLLSHLAVHFSPVFYLILPVYMLFSTPATLQVLQAVVVASAVFPLWLICRRLKLSLPVSAALSFLYLIYPATAGACSFDIHENCFLPAFILWTCYFVEKNKLLPTLIFAFLTLSVKEDAAVYVAFIAIYMIAANKNRLGGILIFALSCMWFIAACNIITALGGEIMTGRYSNFTDEGGSLLTMVKNVIAEPSRVINEISVAEKWEFAALMLIPLGFLPLAAKKYSALFLVCPFILINMMPDYVYQHSIDFQYTFGPLALLFYAAAINLSSFKPRNAKYLLVLGICSAMVLFTMRAPLHGRYFAYLENKTEIETISEGLSLVPDNASVASSTFFVANLSQREILYDLNYMQKTDNVYDVDYIVVDLRFGDDDKYYRECVSNGYESVFYEEGMIAVFSTKGE